MPVVRYRIQNEYGMADPKLYGSAERDDPEALLEGVAMAGLVGVLRQLGDLAEFAAEIFHNLHEEIMATSARGYTLMLRVQQLEVEFPEIEKAVLSQTSHSNLIPNVGMEWHPNIHINKNILTQGDMPRFILNSYEECRGPPQLVSLDKFDMAGAGACLKRYSDPSFFKNEFASSGKMEPEIQREKRARKSKKKGLRLRNGQTLESLVKSNEDSITLVSEKVSNNLLLKRVKLKKRPVNSGNTTCTRSYMEAILYKNPVTEIFLHESAVNQSYLKGKLVEEASEEHEIMVDASSNITLATERGPVNPFVKQSVMWKDSDNLGKGKVENSRKELLWIPNNTLDKFSSLIGRGNNGELLIDHENIVNGNFNDEKMKDSTKLVNKMVESSHVSASDSVTSELENYVDALTTMDSDMDTDTDGKAKTPADSNAGEGIESHTDEEHDHIVHFDSQFEYSNQTLNHPSCHEENGKITVDPAGVSMDVQVPGKNEASSCINDHKVMESDTDFIKYSNKTLSYSSSVEVNSGKVTIQPAGASEKVRIPEKNEASSCDNSGCHSLIVLSGDQEKNSSKDYDVASVKLQESTMAIGSDVPVNTDNNKIHNLKELDESTSLSHGCLKVDNEEIQTSSPYLNPSFNAENCMFNDGSSHQQFAGKQTCDAYLKAISSEDMESTTYVENFDETVSPGNKDILSDISRMRNIEALNLDTMNDERCEVSHEKEISEAFSMNDEHEDAQINHPSAPYALAPEVENISTENFHISKSSPFEHLAKQCQNDDNGEIKARTLAESECLSREMLSEITVVDAQNSDIPKPKVEHFSDEESEVFHDANIPSLSSDNSNPFLPEVSKVSTNALDAESDCSMLVGAQSHPPTISLVSETHIHAFYVQKNVDNYGLATENNDIHNINSTVASSQVSSISKFGLQGELGLHDSISDQNNLKQDKVSSEESNHGLETHSCLVSKKEDNIMIDAQSCDRGTAEHYTDDSADGSLPLSISCREDPLENNEVRLINADVLIRKDQSDTVQAPSVTHPLLSSLSENIFSLSVENENNFDRIGSQELTSEPIIGLSAQMEHEVHDQKLEEAKTAHSSNPLCVAGVAIPAATKDRETIVEKDGVPANHILVSPNCHSSESNKSDGVSDNYLSKNDSKENKGGLCLVESNEVSASESFLHESLVGITSTTCVLSTTYTSILSGSVGTTHSCENNDTSNNRFDSSDNPFVEAKFSNPFSLNTSSDSKFDLFNGDQSEIGAHLPSPTIPELSVRSTNNVSKLNIQPQSAFSGVSEKQASFGNSIMTVNDRILDNASVCNEHEADHHVLQESSPNPSEVFTVKRNTSNVTTPYVASPINQIQREAQIPTQCSTETLLGTPSNKSDTSVGTVSSFEFSIPDFPSKLSDPMGYEQEFNVHVLDNDNLERQLDEGPPLPPLPPLQWRLGKVHDCSGLPARSTSSPPEIVSDDPNSYPNLSEAAYSKDDIPKSEDVRFDHDCWNSVDTRTNTFISKGSRGKDDYGTTSLGEAPNSQFSTTCIDDQERQSEQEDSKEAKQQSFQFVPVTILDTDNMLHVSSNSGEPAKQLNSFIPTPVLEHNESQSNDPILTTNPAQPSNQIESTAESTNFYYSYGDLGDESIKKINTSKPLLNIPYAMHPKDYFMLGEKGSYGPYSFFSVMDYGKPNSKPLSVLNRPRDPLIEAVASHDKSTLRKVSQMSKTLSKPKVDERDTLLEQIRNKSFNLKPAIPAKPNINAPSTNLKVSAILEKANAIRQAFVGSDEDDDDNWSNC